MSQEENKEININILKHLEDLSNQINKTMETKTKNVFSKYPITFGVLILVGVVSLHEGIKGILKEFGFLNISPWYLFSLGIILLLITGTIYKKLDK